MKPMLVIILLLSFPGLSASDDEKNVTAGDDPWKLDLKVEEVSSTVRNALRSTSGVLWVLPLIAIALLCVCLNSCKHRVTVNEVFPGSFWRAAIFNCILDSSCDVSDNPLAYLAFNSLVLWGVLINPLLTFFAVFAIILISSGVIVRKSIRQDGDPWIYHETRKPGHLGRSGAFPQGCMSLPWSMYMPDDCYLDLGNKRWIITFTAQGLLALYVLKSLAWDWSVKKFEFSILFWMTSVFIQMLMKSDPVGSSGKFFRSLHIWRKLWSAQFFMKYDDELRSADMFLLQDFANDKARFWRLAIPLRMFMSFVVNEVILKLVEVAIPLVLMQAEGYLDFVKDSFAIVFIPTIDNLASGDDIIILFKAPFEELSRRTGGGIDTWASKSFYDVFAPQIFSRDLFKYDLYDGLCKIVYLGITGCYGVHDRFGKPCLPRSVLHPSGEERPISEATIKDLQDAAHELCRLACCVGKDNSELVDSDFSDLVKAYVTTGADLSDLKVFKLPALDILPYDLGDFDSDVQEGICPGCSKPLVWSDHHYFDGNGGWFCNNADLCGNGGGNCGNWRWYCADCSFDFCTDCKNPTEDGEYEEYDDTDALLEAGSLE